MSAHGSSSTNWKTTESLRLRPDGDSPSLLASDEVVGFSSARIPNARWCVGPKQVDTLGDCYQRMLAISETMIALIAAHSEARGQVQFRIWRGTVFSADGPGRRSNLVSRA